MKKRKLGIRAKLFLEIGAIIVICLVGIAFVNSRLVESVYTWNTERTLSTIAAEVENAGADYYAVAHRNETEKGVSIDLYDTEDNYLYEGADNMLFGSKLNIISRTENEDGSFFNVVCAEGSTTQYIVFGKDFENNYHIEITVQKDPIRENARIATRVTTTLTVFALILALVYIFAYSKRFTKPLIEMSNVASRIAKLDFSSKCTVKGRDEIGKLAENINTVSDSLSNALGELQEKNIRLQADIERERQIERMRADFISSASHELKTPIAIIRGYSEGLKMSVSEDNTEANEYCDIIMREADRMNSLVLNMLEQSLYTSGAKQPDMTVFELNEFIEDFLKTLTPIFEEKGVDTVFRRSQPLMVKADKGQYTTVLSNIVLNACSHASGEKRVEISLEELEDCIRVCVFNTGSHIEEKDREGIFTAFYRADKAHSRAEGRFGLGLAIVKSITENHNCVCDFENLDNGVTFRFTIKKEN